MDVLVLDLANFPRPKLCAGWVTPEVVEDLELDVGSYPHSFMSFDRLHFHIKGIHFAKKTTQHSIRRIEFDEFLLQRSSATVHEHQVKKIVEDDGSFIVDDKYRCKYLVGAGGTRCPVYRQLFHELNPRAKHLQIATLEKEFPYERQDDQYHLWFLEDGLPGFSWYVPKANGHINVGLGGKAEKMKFSGRRLQDFWRGFSSRLGKDDLVCADFKPAGYSYDLRGNVDVVRKGNAMIIGDSIGLASIDMGEGIGPAVGSALLAARAISSHRDCALADVAKYSVPEFVGKRSPPLVSSD